MLDRYCELVFTTLPQTVVSLLLYGSGALGWCLNYNVDNCTFELKYYEYVEQDKNYLKFYCVLESKYYQFAKSFNDYLKLTDTVDQEYLSKY